MNLVRYKIQVVIILLRTLLTGLRGLLDIWLSKGQVNEKRLREVEQDERDIRGKIVIVTGSNSGIGKQTAGQLAGRGAKVIMACRDPTRAEVARQDILKVNPKAQLEFMQIDLSDLESIRSFVREFKSRYHHLDVLVNNAGIDSRRMTTTKDGFESHIGTNYLGTFLLTLLLLDCLVKAVNARIVFLSSSTIALEVLDLNNLMMKDQQLGIYTRYSNSKLCLAMFSKQLASLLSGSNVTTYAICTGFVDTNLRRREQRPWHFWALEELLDRTILVSLENGTATVLYCVLSKSLGGESGRFYRFLTEWKAADKVIERHSKENLWNISENLVGLSGFANNFFNDLRNTA